MPEFARFEDYAGTKIDQRRSDYLSTLFQAAKFVVAESSLRARALYFHQVGGYTTSLNIGPASRDELAERRFRLLICRPSDE